MWTLLVTMAAIAILATVTLLHAVVATNSDARTARRSSRDARWSETMDQRTPPPAVTTQWPTGLMTTGRQSSSTDQYRTLSSLIASASEAGGATVHHHHHDDHEDRGGSVRQQQRQQHRQHQQHQQHHQHHQVAGASGAPDDVYPEPLTTEPSYGTGATWTAADDKLRRPTAAAVVTADYSMDDGNRMELPKWSTHKYLPSHRQLKKYGPLIVETEVTTDSGDGTAVGYDSVTDYSNNVAAYDTVDNGFYKQPGGTGGDGSPAPGWYGEVAASRPAVEMVRPAPVAASKTSSFDLQNLSALALVKIGLIKLKLLAAIKFLALLAVKLKALTLLKVMLLAKFAAIGKLFNLLVLPFLPGLLTWLRNASLFQLNPAATSGMQMASAATSEASTANAGVQLRNDSLPAERAATVAERSATTDGLDDGAFSLATTASLFRYVAAKSDKCVERLACRVAGTRPLNFQSVWVDWILSSMAKYIPNRKLKSYMATFKDVSDYRLENIFTQPSTAEWLKWCDKRYVCEEDSINNNTI